MGSSSTLHFPPGRPSGSRGKGAKKRNTERAGLERKADSLETTLARRLNAHRATNRGGADNDWVWIFQQRELGSIPKKGRKGLAQAVILRALALAQRSPEAATP